MRNPNEDDGRPKLDTNNPDPAKRARPVLGIALLQGFVRAPGEDNVWKDGRIYNPEDGQLYRCILTLESPDRLRVRGYIGIPLFGRSQVWPRVP